MRDSDKKLGESWSIAPKLLQIETIYMEFQSLFSGKNKKRKEKKYFEMSSVESFIKTEC